MQEPLSRRALLRQPGFVTISVAFALGLFAQIGLFAHLIARLEPSFGSGLAAAAISLITLCAVAGRTLLGWLLGGHDRRLAAAANLLMQSTGALLLAFGEGMAPLAAGCVLFGLGVGNLTSLPPLIAQREFRTGRRRHGGSPGHRHQPGGLRLRAGDLRLAARFQRQLHRGILGGGRCPGRGGRDHRLRPAIFLRGFKVL